MAILFIPITGTNILPIKSIAKSKLDERKITHPNIVKIKVINTDGIFPKPENNFKRNNLSNIKNKPWYAPQRIKVHSAPCQKPETKKHKIKLKYIRAGETLLPPNAI